MLTRYEFEVLQYLEKNRECSYNVRSISDNLRISGNEIIRCIEKMVEKDFIIVKDNHIILTSKGLEALEPHRVKKAIIVAAGFGSRMMPATADRPKPMVTVNGVRIIDTLIDALLAVDITDIVVIGGYKISKLNELKNKYPSIKILDNKKYNTENNISSALLASAEMTTGCYFCEADLYVSNPEIITKYQYCSNILSSVALETDDWCFDVINGAIDNYRKGGTYCYNYYGISYWTSEDCIKLKEDWKSAYNKSNGADLFWEFVPLIESKENYRVEIRLCNKQDIIEIDNYYELALLDSSYK